MKIFLYILSLFSAFALFSSVTRSELSDDFRSSDYNVRSGTEIKLVNADAKNDIPDLFEQKFSITDKSETDSTLQEINGFRVQIFKSENLNEAKKREEMYIENFGEDNVLLIFEKPFYKIRVGRLRNKDEAIEFQDVLRKMGISETIIIPDAVKVLMPAVKQTN